MPNWSERGADTWSPFSSGGAITINEIHSQGSATSSGGTSKTFNVLELDVSNANTIKSGTFEKTTTYGFAYIYGDSVLLDSCVTRVVKTFDLSNIDISQYSTLSFVGTADTTRTLYDIKNLVIE